jgi:serine/threonine protein kinase
MRLFSTGTLIDQLHELKLLSSEQMMEVLQAARGRCGDGKILAKALVQRGWLTMYQANQLIEGNAKELVIGPYHVLQRLGEGGLSFVYKARHIEHGTIRALKLIRREALTSQEGRQQFLQEMEAMARLNHPNIVQFCDLDQVGDTFYFAMEFVEGTDLGKVVQLSGQLPVARACDYIRQTAFGLQHAHEHNLVHRDIKPMNLLLTHPPVNADDGPGAPTYDVVKILDWGLATFQKPTPEKDTLPAEELEKGLMGTADYLSPEQARDPDRADIRSDIYSLGCTLYFLLTGRPPFGGGTVVQKILRHQHAEPTGVENFRSDVPPEVIAILKRMMAKRPENRFRTPDAVALAIGSLKRILKDVTPPRTIVPPTGLPSVADQTPMPDFSTRVSWFRKNWDRTLTPYNTQTMAK